MIRKTALIAGLLAVLTGPAQGAWQLERLPDAGGVMAHTLSENTFRLQNETHRAMLAVRCMEETLHAFVRFGGVINVGDAVVAYRFDDAGAVRETWSIGMRYETLFSPNPRQLAQSLQRLYRLSVMTSPYGQPPILLEFDLSGSAGPVGQVLAACPGDR